MMFLCRGRGVYVKEAAETLLYGVLWIKVTCTTFDKPVYHIVGERIKVNANSTYSIPKIETKDISVNIE